MTQALWCSITCTEFHFECHCVKAEICILMEKAWNEGPVPAGLLFNKGALFRAQCFALKSWWWRSAGQVYTLLLQSRTWGCICASDIHAPLKIYTFLQLLALAKLNWTVVCGIFLLQSVRKAENAASLAHWSRHRGSQSILQQVTLGATISSLLTSKWESGF